MNTKIEFVVSNNPNLKSEKSNIEDLFDIKFKVEAFPINSDYLWITAEGHSKKVSHAKNFIVGLCSPEKQIVISYPPVLQGILKVDLWKKCLQVMTSASVEFIPDCNLRICGLELNVLLAQSAFESLVNCFNSKEPKNNSETFNSVRETYFLSQLLNLDIEWDDYQSIPNDAKNILLNWLGELNNFNSDVDSVEFKTACCSQESPGEPKPAETAFKIRVSDSSSESTGEDDIVVLNKDSDTPGQIPNTKNKKRKYKRSTKSRVNSIDCEQEMLRELYEKQYISDNDVSPVAKKLFANSTCKNSISKVAFHQPLLPRPQQCVLPRLEPSNLPTPQQFCVKSDEPKPLTFVEPTLLKNFLQTSQTAGSFSGVYENTVFRARLRPVVIDGSNVAMAHGNNKIFSCQGILICVNYFKKRGHSNITVFLPRWRSDQFKMDHNIPDQLILSQLENEGILKLTPSRRVRQQLITSYDDRFIVQLATEIGGIMVSNDNYRDLMRESKQWQETIEKRLLLYTFANDIFMAPEDPLGRNGPVLSEFLSFPQNPSNRSQMVKQNLNKPELQARPIGQVLNTELRTSSIGKFLSNGPLPTKSSSLTSGVHQNTSASSGSNKPQTSTLRSNNISGPVDSEVIAVMTDTHNSDERNIFKKLLEIFPKKSALITRVLQSNANITDIMILANHVIEME